MLKDVLNKENIEGAIKTVGGFVVEGIKVVGPIIGVMYLNNRRKAIVNMIEHKREATYSDAVRAINNNNIFSEDTSTILSALRPDGNSEYYKAVISVVNSNMFSSDKVKTILNMSKKQDKDLA